MTVTSHVLLSKSWNISDTIMLLIENNDRTLLIIENNDMIMLLVENNVWHNLVIDSCGIETCGKTGVSSYGSKTTGKIQSFGNSRSTQLEPRLDQKFKKKRVTTSIPTMVDFNNKVLNDWLIDLSIIWIAEMTTWAYDWNSCYWLSFFCTRCIIQ